MLKPTVELPISERAFQMVNNALSALVNELDSLGLDDEATQVYFIKRHVKNLGKEGKLTYSKEVEKPNP